MKPACGLLLLLLGLALTAPAVELIDIAWQAGTDPLHVEREISGVAVFGVGCGFYTALGVYLFSAAVLSVIGARLLTADRRPA